MQRAATISKSNMHSTPTRRMRTQTTQPRNIGRRLAVTAAALLLLAGAMGAWLLLSSQGTALRNELRSRSPQELIRYTLRRLEGHPKLEWALHPLLFVVQRHLEREPPANLPSLGKGQIKSARQNMQGITRVLTVNTPQAIRRAMLEATAGTYIEIAPGLYPFNSALTVRNGGSTDAPIVVGAKQPGSVWLTFEHVDGIMVNRPYWAFENLNIRGVCANHNTCEHAFHVTGQGSHSAIRNNFLVDFNAHIKVNGFRGNWPDHGTAAHNTLTLTKPRETENPVVAFDLVGASNWLVSDNLVTNIVKNRGKTRVSYGMYMKGASQNGRFERNLVVCTTTGISRPGIRVGISFGGGNTGKQYCRDQRCEREHINGMILNNVVAHCNDSGVDINRSAPVLVAHNTLINTAGITVRQQPANALLVGNLYDGMALTRDETTLSEVPEPTTSAHTALIDADALNLKWAAQPQRIGMHPDANHDFFIQPRNSETAPGAIEIAAPAVP